MTGSTPPWSSQLYASNSSESMRLNRHNPGREPDTVQLPTSPGKESPWEVLCELPSGDEHQGRQGDSRNHSQVANGLHQEQPAPGGSRAPHRSVGTRLDELLRPVLPIEVCSSPSPSQRGPGWMGATEVQTVSTLGAGLDALAERRRATGSELVRPVAARRTTGGWIVGAG